MGFIISKFRRSKPSPEERLEQIDKDLRDILRYKVDTELEQKKTIGRLILFSALLYLLAAFAAYLFAPKHLSWSGTAKYVIPFLVFPILMWSLKRLVTFLYQKRITNKKDQYDELKKEKIRILEDAMDTMPFNVCKRILEKYAPGKLLPKYLEQNAPAINMSPVGTPIGQNSQPRLSRTPGPRMGSPQGRDNMPGRRSMPARGNYGPSAISTPIRPMLQAPPGSQMRPGPMRQPQPTFMLPPPPSNPVMQNRSMGWMDKLVEYVVGDGPSNRYALICRYCATHNGLATTEEYPYIGFRCVYCKQYNPPKQSRPAAPKLPTNTVIIEEVNSTNKSESQINVNESETESSDKAKKDNEPIVTEKESDIEDNALAPVEESEQEKQHDESEEEENKFELDEADTPQLRKRALLEGEEASPPGSNKEEIIDESQKDALYSEHSKSE